MGIECSRIVRIECFIVVSGYHTSFTRDFLISSEATVGDLKLRLIEKVKDIKISTVLVSENLYKFPRKLTYKMSFLEKDYDSFIVFTDSIPYSILGDEEVLLPYVDEKIKLCLHGNINDDDLKKYFDQERKKYESAK